MSEHSLALRPDPGLPALPSDDVLSAWLSGRSPRTLDGYRRDIELFAAWAGQPSAQTAIDVFLNAGQAGANRIALAYRADLTARGLASATIARRLAALRSMCKVARLIGRTNWALDVESPRVEPRRDMRGPDRDGVRALWRVAESADGPRAARDRAVLALLFDLGLRRGELCGLDRADVEQAPEGRPIAVWALGKGRSEKERLTLPGPTAAVVKDWIEVRGDGDGPLFHRLDRRPAGRLTGQTVRRIVRALGERAGLDRAVRPHGLRHAAATAALDMGRDVRDVRCFTRHRSLEMVMRYDDQRRDVAGSIAGQLATARAAPKARRRRSPLTGKSDGPRP